MKVLLRIKKAPRYYILKSQMSLFGGGDTHPEKVTVRGKTKTYMATRHKSNAKAPEFETRKQVAKTTAKKTSAKPLDNDGGLRHTDKQEVKKMDTTIDMPELTGSEKQIKWANDIRKTKVAKLQELSQRLSGDRAVKFNKSIKLCSFIKNAKWWIDHRDDSGINFIKVLTATLRSLLGKVDVPHFDEVVEQIMQAWNDQDAEDNPTVVRYHVYPASGGTFGKESDIPFATREEAEAKVKELKGFDAIIKEEAHAAPARNDKNDNKTSTNPLEKMDTIDYSGMSKAQQSKESERIVEEALKVNSELLSIESESKELQQAAMSHSDLDMRTMATLNAQRNAGKVGLGDKLKWEKLGDYQVRLNAPNDKFYVKTDDGDKKVTSFSKELPGSVASAAEIKEIRERITKSIRAEYTKVKAELYPNFPPSPSMVAYNVMFAHVLYEVGAATKQHLAQQIHEFRGAKFAGAVGDAEEKERLRHEM